MPKSNIKKQRHSSLIDTPFTQRTAYFKQQFETDPYRTLPSKTTLKTIIHNQNLNFHNKYTNQNQCFKNIINDKLINSKMGMKKSLNKIVSTCFKQNNKENIDNYQSLEKKIERIVESKINKMLEIHIERHLSKFLDQQKHFIKSLWASHEKQINDKVSKVEKGYDDILQTYDNFLNIVEKIKDKSFKTQKFMKKVQFQTVIQKTQRQMHQVHQKIGNITTQLQSLKKSQNYLHVQHEQIKPIILKYQEQNISLQQFKVVVNTYNQNFMQIDQKLQELYSYFT